MSPSGMALVRLLLASGGCMVAGGGVWALTLLCRRHLPALAAQRALWLLGQLTVLAAFLLILLPHSERLRVIPPIELDGPSAARALAPGAAAVAAPAMAGLVVPAPAGQRAWLSYCAQAWLPIYLLGLVCAMVRLWRARRTLQGLAVAGCRLGALDRHAGFAAVALPLPVVMEVDAPISPMLFGLFRPCLLLPLHLRGFAVAQQQMIVAHELTHLRRRDLEWTCAAVFLQTLLWFNPFMRLLRANLSWAQELGCDRAVLRGQAPAQRQAYAAALVAQLRLQQLPAATALAFGARGTATLAHRIALIRQPASAPASPWAYCAVFAGLATIVAACLALQPAPASQVAAWPGAPAAGQHAARWIAATGAPAAAIACLEMADAASGSRLLRQGQCDLRVTPASTFNIAVSLMGYDSGILRDAHAPALPFRPGYADWNPAWRATTDPAGWLRHSVLWYAQQVTSRLGAARFQGYVRAFGYGNQDVSGDAGQDNGLTLSWLSSSLTISAAEQVDFLRKVVNRELPLSDRAYDMTQRIMASETLDNGWVVHGKTGTAAALLPDGGDDARHQYGWFVGWASKGARTIVFARMVLDQRRETGAAGVRVKAAFLRELPARLAAL